MNDQDKIIDITSREKTNHGILKCLGRGLLFIGSALTFIRNFIANAVMVLVIIAVVIAYNAASSLKEKAEKFLEGDEVQESLITRAEKSRILYLDLSGPISVAPLGSTRIAAIERQIRENLHGIKTHELLKIEMALELAADDDNIDCVLISLDNMEPVNMAVADRIASKAALVRNAGKKVIAAAMNYSQSALLVASAANEIVLDPIGSIDLKGLSLQSLYYRDFLDKIMVTPYVFRAGHYKSAVEPYLFNEMSTDVRAEQQELVNELWEIYQKKLRSFRKILSKDPILPPSAAAYASSLRLYQGDTALMQYESNLVDSLDSKNNLLRELAAEYGPDSELSLYPELISYEDYLRLNPQQKTENPGAKAAILYGLGPIVSDARSEQSFSPDNLVPLLDEIENEGSYDAVILYLDSPGGLTVPSEILRRSLNNLKNSGIKVYVSINGTGASGAYMVATGADKIIASEDSLVGSIGVFAIGVGAHNLLNNFGITQDGVTSHDLAEVNIANPLSHAKSQIMQLNVDNTYRRFIEDVCKARDLDENNYINFAEGQVFSAQAALNLGLIDKIGSLEDTLTLVAQDLEVARSDLLEEHLTVQRDHRLSYFEKFFFTMAEDLLPGRLAAAIESLRTQHELTDETGSPAAISLTAVPLL